MQLATHTLLSLSLLAPALAQQPDVHLRIHVSGTQVADVSFLELGAGAILSNEVTSLVGLPPFAFVPTGIDWIDDEIWIPSTGGLLRFTSAPITFIETLFVADNIRNVVPITGGAMLFGLTEAIEVDFDGVEIQRQPFGGHKDIICYQGGFLGIPTNLDEVRRYDSSLVDLGTFAPNAATLTSAFGLPYLPRRLTLLANGGVAIAAAATIVLVDTSGVSQVALNPTAFETDVLETSTGQLFVPAGGGSCLVDAGSGEVIFLDGVLANEPLSYYSSARRAVSNPASERVCSTSPNSVGGGALALLLGSDNLSLGSLTFASVDLPPGEFALSIYGQGLVQNPFGDGFLCVGPGLVRTPIQAASAGGGVSTQMDLATPGLGGELLPGTTWIFQTLYRDAALVGGTGLNASDAVSLTFRP